MILNEGCDNTFARIGALRRERAGEAGTQGKKD